MVAYQTLYQKIYMWLLMGEMAPLDLPEFPISQVGALRLMPTLLWAVPQ
jgi:hypothetical protein